MKIGSLLDLDREIAAKPEYNPTGELKAYIDRQTQEYSLDVQQFLKPFRLFNRRNFLDYLTLAEDDFYKYVEKPVDPNDWRNFIRTGEERNKIDGLTAFLLDLNFHAEPEARDWQGNVTPEMGEFNEALLTYVNILDNTEVKDHWTDIAMFTHGTVFKQVQFTNRRRVQKIAGEWVPGTTEEYKYETRMVDDFEGIETTLLRPNRIFLADITQSDERKQDHIWYERLMPYAKAYELFHEYTNWKYVKPWRADVDAWTNTEFDVEADEDVRVRRVKVRVRESLTSDEYSIYCNRVLLTPPGLKMPEDEYSIFYQQASLLQPVGDFAYGRSMIDNIRPYVGVRDVLTSILVDKSRQLLEPPLKSRFRTMINRYMYKPAAVTPMQGEGDLTPLIPESAMQNFVFEAIKVYEQMTDRASISPVFSGQSMKGQMTKYEVEQLLTQSIRAVAGMVGAAVAWRRKEARLKTKLALKHFTRMTGFRFEAQSQDRNLSRNVEFLPIPNGSGSDARRVRGAIIHRLAEAENLRSGSRGRVRFYAVDPEKVKDYSFVVNFRVNPQSRSSKAGDERAMLEKITQYASRPGIDQRAVDRALVRMYNDDENEFLAKEQQPAASPAAAPSAAPPPVPPEPVI